MRIALLIGHFGSIPGWYPLWEESALRNPMIEFHILTDCVGLETRDNIIIHECALDVFVRPELFDGPAPELKTPYKITDFRPLFGEIFADLLDGYDYWGFGDLDVVYGDIQEVFGASFGHCDYISTGREGRSGPLAFLANTPEVNRLWRDIPGVEERLRSSEFFAMDELDLVELLRDRVRCDLEFRECLDDLPARWQDGNLTGIRSGRAHALHHFGGRLSHTRAQIVRDADQLLEAMQQGRPVRISHDARMQVETAAVLARDNLVSALRQVKRGLARS